MRHGDSTLSVCHWPVRHRGGGGRWINTRLVALVRRRGWRGRRVGHAVDGRERRRGRRVGHAIDGRERRWRRRVGHAVDGRERQVPRWVGRRRRRRGVGHAVGGWEWQDAAAAAWCRWWSAVLVAAVAAWRTTTWGRRVVAGCRWRER